jgi:acyl-CoA thioester hydrolase
VRGDVAGGGAGGRGTVMPQAPRRQKGGYFAVEADAPRPLIARVKYRVRFSDVDPMAIVWHGRYTKLFEQASEELGLACGLGYADFYRERLQAPIVQLHLDYFAPIVLGEEVAIVGRMIWTDSARINTEFEVHKESGVLAAAGYTVQMFIDASSMPLLASPSLLEKCRARWRGGEFRGMQ